MLPLNRTLAFNFILGTFNSQETIDNDDGEPTVQYDNDCVVPEVVY